MGRRYDGVAGSGTHDAGEVGIPLGRLRRWARLRRAIGALGDGGVAGAAQAGGFADQPHLTRTAGRLVGRTPGTLAASPP